MAKIEPKIGSEVKLEFPARPGAVKSKVASRHPKAATFTVDALTGKTGDNSGRNPLSPRDEFVAEQAAIFVRNIRKKAGLTQEQLAEKAHLSQGRISQIENAMSEPSTFALVKIAEACGRRLFIQAVNVGEAEQSPPGVFLSPHSTRD